jgi:hypothetical protein
MKALYWGYSGKDASNMASNNPYQTAMNSIKAQIEKDYENLHAKLLRSGPIR